MTGAPVNLPHVDDHTITIVGSREVVWAALQRYVETGAGVRDGGLLGRLLGADPPSGFEVTASLRRENLTLSGRHRFSRYSLRFELTDASNGVTQVRARTYARFPGLRGRVYRTLVIGTGAHVVATRHILHSIRSLTYLGPPGQAEDTCD